MPRQMAARLHRLFQPPVSNTLTLASLRHACRIACILAGAAACADAPPIEPVRICEVLEDSTAFGGKAALVVGRYSFRERGVFLGEDCRQGASAQPAAFELVYDSKTGPATPAQLAIDSTALRRKLAVVKQATSLGKFKFGSQEYDRWAVAYGRIEIGAAAPPGPSPHSREGEFRVPGRLVCRGSGLVVFLAEP